MPPVIISPLNYEDKAVLRVYLAERQIIDVVRDYPAKLSANNSFVDALTSYGTSSLFYCSSQGLKLKNEVHLTWLWFEI